VFHPDAWEEPDEWEQNMRNGATVELPAETRRWHQQRRHLAATDRWYAEHPEADHRLEELLEGIGQDWRQS
jgi:hypothetical protein